MKPVTVYIDVLFIVNFIIDYFLLSATAAVRRLKYSKLRLLPAAAVGALYSCLMFFPEIAPAYTVPGKLLLSAVMTFTAFKYRGFRSFALTFICFHASSVALAGIVMGVEMIFSPQNMLVSNGEFYINISAAALVGAAAVSYAVMLLVSRFFKPRGKEELHELKVTADGKSAEMTALYDSGNQLTDAVTGAGVIIVSRPSLKDVIPPEVKPAFEPGADVSAASGTKWQTRVCMIPFSTVGGHGLLPAFRPDEVVLDGIPLEEKTVVAVKSGKLNEKYDAIIGNVR